ncbi:MAG: hypothetical protein LAO51_00070 [Acidobacteriia bacterium]|nr:hypothetical protein [Terriglobia bacterium]
MPRLYVLDHSLVDLGGHHYEYDLHVLRAAEQAGWEPVLGSHVRCRAREHLPANWAVAPVFHFDMYSKHTVLFGRSRLPVNPFLGGAPEDRGGRSSARKRLDAWKVRWRQRRRLRLFARSCRRLFERFPPGPGDQVFLPTISEFDLVGLAEFLRSYRHARVPDWHAQFHFGFLEGRVPEYDGQSELLHAMRAHFEHVRALIPEVRLHLYATTPQLASQYELLGVFPCRPLAYPVNPALAERPAGDPAGPVRVVCAGGVRDEKGTHHLRRVVEDLARDDFFGGRLQLWVQAERVDQIPHGGASSPVSADPGDRTVPGGTRIVHVRHPLPLDEYLRLIAAADVGLFLYDERRYAARLSAILVEMLSAGASVVVPAGCWLSDEVAEASAAHLERLAREMRGVAARDAALPRVLRCGGTEAPAFADCAAPEGATELQVSFRWSAGTARGHHARIEIVQGNDRGDVLDRWAAVCGSRTDSRASIAMFHMHPEARSLRLRFSNAYFSTPIDLSDVEIRFLAADDFAGGRCPEGQVGLIAADFGQFPDLLREIARHREHYRTAAASFSADYFRRHHPSNVLRILTDTAG